MSDKQYRLQSGAANHYHDGEPAGNEPFAPTETERQMLGDLLVPVHGDTEADDNDTSNDADGTGDEEADSERAAEFVDNDATDVAAAIADGQADGHLAEIRGAENDGRDGGRVTVHDALDGRADEIGEDAGERADKSEE